MARWTASAKWAAGPALDGQRDMPLARRLSEGLGVTVCPELTLDEKGGYSSVGCFIEDGGGPPGVGLQEQASNRHELLG